MVVRVAPKTSAKPRSPRWMSIVVVFVTVNAVGVSVIFLSDWLLRTFGRIATTGDVTGRPFVLHAAVLGIGQTILLGALLFGIPTALLAYRYVIARRKSDEGDWVFPVMRASRRPHPSGSGRATKIRGGHLPYYMVCQMSATELVLWGDRDPVASLLWSEINDVQIEIGSNGPRRRMLTVFTEDGTGPLQMSILSSSWLVAFERNDDVLLAIQHFAKERIYSSPVSED